MHPLLVHVYMSITVRNDITFAVGKCARGMHNPQPKHVVMLKQLVGYLKKTKGYKLVYCQYGNPAETLFKDISNIESIIALPTQDWLALTSMCQIRDIPVAPPRTEEREKASGRGHSVYQFF